MVEFRFIHKVVNRTHAMICVVVIWDTAVSVDVACIVVNCSSPIGFIGHSMQHKVGGESLRKPFDFIHV